MIFGTPELTDSPGLDGRETRFRWFEPVGLCSVYARGRETRSDEPEAMNVYYGAVPRDERAGFCETIQNPKLTDSPGLDGRETQFREHKPEGYVGTTRTRAGAGGIVAHYEVVSRSMKASTNIF